MHRLILRTAILLLVATIAVTLRAAVPGEEQTLKGIQGFEVVIEDLASDVEAAGLHRTDIQTDVELKLRLAGIKVLPMEERLKEPGYPYLYVNVHVIFTEAPLLLAVYNISCQLNQDVTLIRDAFMIAVAPTWATSTLGYVGRNNLQSIRDSVKNLVDRFINAYLSVNPR